MISVQTNVHNDDLIVDNENFVNIVFTLFEVDFIYLFNQFIAFSFFKKSNKSCNLSEIIEYKCAFWNISSNNWETTGCRHYLSGNKHFCSCNHTINFVLLIVKMLLA